MKRNKHGLTIIEMLTVLAVVAILIGLLLPAYKQVHRAALNTKQRAQLVAIGIGLESFRQDQDLWHYPDSNASPVGRANYTGAQKLAEAMLGRDLLGYHPDQDLSTADVTVRTVLVRREPYPGYPIPPFEKNVRERKDLFLEVDTANPQRVQHIDDARPGLYRDATQLSPLGASLVSESFVLCDVFAKGPTRESGTVGRAIKAGSPILYFRADTTKLGIRFQGTTHADLEKNIYNFYDNVPLLETHRRNVELSTPAGMGPFIQFGPVAFYGVGSDAATMGFVQDPRTPLAWPKPYNPDSYLLISAGHDGLYGTDDDIKNFGN